MSITVQFHHDETIDKWMIFVTGVNSDEQAIEAFHKFLKYEQVTPIDMSKTEANHIAFGLYAITPKEIK